MMADSAESQSEEQCIVPKCPQCREPMMVGFRGGDLSKPFFGHRKYPNNCKTYLDGILCKKAEAIRYPSERPKAAKKQPSTEKSAKRSRSKKTPKVDAAWANNTLTRFGEPPGLDPSWTGD